MNQRACCIVMLGCVAGLEFSDARAQSPILVGPYPYRCFDTAATSATGDCASKDSPFKNTPFDWFHFEDYEDEDITSPGVILIPENCGNVPSSYGCPIISDHYFNDDLTDSVDEDDGAIDGFGRTTPTGGKALWAHTAIRVQFDATVLGYLPTHAGFVWTDGGAGTITEFRAWDSDGNLIGFRQATLEDGTNHGTTVDDYFFGVFHTFGISAIEVRNLQGGVEIDHLQYGRSDAPVPARTATWGSLKARYQ